jgi:HlyD family secretion protein
MRAGELNMQQMRTESEAIYKTLGVDGRVARACQMRDRGQTGQRSEAKGQSEQAGSGANQNRANQSAPNANRSSASQRQGAAPVQAGEFSPMRVRARPALVFVADSTGFKPRVVRVGAANLDYTEIVSGLNEGERVAMLAVAQAAAARAQANDRMRSMTGGGMPGAPPGGGGGQRPPGR